MKNQSSNRVSLGLKCSECLHFSRGPRRFERLCAQLGVEPFTPACPEFCPDQTYLAKVGAASIQALAKIAAELSQPQLRLLAYTFRNADLIKKAGFAFGQQVVFSINGHDYLDCYFRGYVVGASKNGQTVYLSSDMEGLNENNAMLSLPRTSVMQLEAFKEKRKKMVQANRLAVPVSKWRTLKRRSVLELLRLSPEQASILKKQLEDKPLQYEPPSIDSVPVEWLDQRQAGTLKQRKPKPEKYNVKPPSDKLAEKKSHYEVNRYQ